MAGPYWYLSFLLFFYYTHYNYYDKKEQASNINKGIAITYAVLTFAESVYWYMYVIIGCELGQNDWGVDQGFLKDISRSGK